MGKKKSSTTSTQNSTVTSTPTNPEWVTGSAQGLQSRINSLLDTDASSMIPGASDLQKLAFDRAEGMGRGQTAVQGILDAAPMSAQSASARSLLDVDLDGYQNPWEDAVVDTSLANFDETAGMREAELAAAQGLGQNFSDSGSAIERALFKRGVTQDRAGTEATLRAQGFDRATGLATGDLDREASVSTFNAGQANQMALADRAAKLQAAGLLGDMDARDIGLLSDLGAQQREIEREELGAEPELLKLISALNSNQPYQLFHGSTQTGQTTGTSKTKSSGGLLDTVAGAVGAAGSLASGLGAMGLAFSDKRLKEDIKPAGKDGAGRKLFAFRYRGEPKAVTRVGHIAQDIEKREPHAVRKIGGYKAIDYGLLGEAA